MKSDQPFRCYRCTSVTRYLSTASTPATGELTIVLECPNCGQHYEIQLVPVAIFATTPEGEAQALLHYCTRCGQLYRSPDDEPHLCLPEGSVPPDRDYEGRGT